MPEINIFGLGFWIVLAILHVLAILSCYIANFVDDVIRYAGKVKRNEVVHNTYNLRQELDAGMKEFHSTTSGLHVVLPWVFVAVWLVVVVWAIVAFLLKWISKGSPSIVMAKMLLLMVGIRETKTEEEVKE